MQNYFDLSGGKWVFLVLFVLFVVFILYLNWIDEHRHQKSKRQKKSSNVPRIYIQEYGVDLGKGKDQIIYFTLVDDPTLIKGETIIHLN